MSKITVELTEADVRLVLSNYIGERYSVFIKPEYLLIQVKSKQNYKSEWEEAAIRVFVNITG